MGLEPEDLMRLQPADVHRGQRSFTPREQAGHMTASTPSISVNFLLARAVRACTESSVLIHGSGGWRRERPAMTAPLSQDLRGRIARLVEQGSSVRAAAERFEVSPSAAIKLMQRVRATGSTAPAKIGGYRRPILEPYAETLRSIATSRPGITLKEMREALHDLGIEVKALSTVAEMLQRLGLTHKKRA